MKEKKKFFGPVLIYSVNNEKINPLIDNGCGHIQFVIIGPTPELVMQTILHESTFKSILEKRGNCLVCGMPLKGVWVLPMEYMDSARVKELENKISVRIPRLLMMPFSGDDVEVFLKYFTSEEIKRAELKVLYTTGDNFYKYS